MGLFSKFTNFINSLSPERMYEQANQAFQDGDLYRLNDIVANIVELDMPDKFSAQQLLDKLKKQKADDFFAKYLERLEQIIPDDFSSKTIWVYPGLEHPDDSTLISLYFTGDGTWTSPRLKISCNKESDNDFSKVRFSNDARITDAIWYMHDWYKDEQRYGENLNCRVIDIELYYHLYDFTKSRNCILDKSGLDSMKFATTEFCPILRYFNNSLTNGNGLKMRFITDSNRVITTRDLSQIEIDGLQYMITAHFETANYLRSLLNLAPLPTI